MKKSAKNKSIYNVTAGQVDLYKYKRVQGFYSDPMLGYQGLTVVTSFMEFSCISLMFSTKKGETPNVDNYKDIQFIHTVVN